MAEIEKAGRRILVVEDDGIIAARLESILTRLGYDVLGIVAFGEDVLPRVSQSPPDLVLMDVYLAGEVNGVEAAVQVRAAYDIPVVYLTAFADDALLQQAKLTEPYGYLVKPVQDKELHATIEMAFYRHRLETQLKEHERWLDTTLRSIGDAVIATDEGGRVIFMNPVAEGLTGWEQAEAVGHDLSEVFHIVNATTRELVENPVTRVLQEGAIVGLASHTVLVARDGTQTPIDDNAAPIRDDKGNITGVVLVFRDVTARVRAEEALRESEEKYSALVEQARDGVVIIQDNDLKFANRGLAEISGYTVEEMLSMPFEDMLTPESREIITQRAKLRMLGEPVPSLYEATARCKDGAEKKVEISAGLISYQGRPANMAVVRDVTERVRMEQALRESEERYRTYVENAPDGIFIVDSDGRYLDVNEAACRMTGYSRNELLNMSIRELAPPDAPPEAFEAFEKLKRTGEAHDEIVIQRKDGSILHASLNAVALSGGRYMAFCSDITERVRAESQRDATLQALRESEARYRALFDNMSDGVAIYQAAHDGEDFVFVDFNKAGEKIDGVKRENLVGKSVLQMFSGVKDFGLFEVFHKVWATGEPEHHPISMYRDGRITGWRENFVYKLPSGEIVAVYSDETERQRAEETRQELVHALGERVKELNCLYGISRLVERPGISLEELLQGAVDLIPPAWQYPASACARVILQGREFKTQGFKETPWKQASDVVVYGEPSGSVEVAYLEKKPPGDEGPFLEQERNLLDAIAMRVGRISERAQVEAERDALIAELETKNTELERFTYTISHDLKSPLITIQGFLSLLLQDVASGDAERIETDVGFISSAVNTMNQLLDELLELSRIGRVVNAPEEVLMGALVREAVGMVTGELNERGVQVEIAPDLLRPDGATVHGDRTRLREMVANLVVNAAKYMGDQPDPRVEIGLRDGDETVFFVRDNGIGIDPRYHDKIFDLFEKLDARTEGVGVGLAIVKRIVEVHGGRVWVESEGEGHGSTFCFTLAGE